MTVNVSAVPKGNHILEWPAFVQDTIFKAIETHEKRTGRKYEIVNARADKDIDTGPYISVTIRAPRYEDERLTLQ